MESKVSIKGRVYFSVAFFMIAAVFGGTAGAQTSALSAQKLTKTETMLKEIGAEYSRPVPAQLAFVVPYSGKEMKAIDLFVIEAAGGLVVMVDVAAGKDVNLTPAVLRKLLEFNAAVDYIKVGISDDGSIRVQTEQNLLAMTSAELQKLLDQAASGADDVAKILAPVRKKPAAR